MFVPQVASLTVAESAVVPASPGRSTMIPVSAIASRIATFSLSPQPEWFWPPPLSNLWAALQRAPVGFAPLPSHV